MTTIYADTAEANDIQIAVNQASVGDTVQVPTDTANYPPSVFSQSNIETDIAVLIPGGINVVGAGKENTILQQTDEVRAIFFEVDGRNGYSSRISGMSFKGNVTDEDIERVAIAIYGTKDFRIDHSAFDGFTSAAIFNHRYGYENQGVIDHNEFDNTYKEQTGTWNWGYGLNLQAGSFAWEPLNDLLGQYKDGVVYIEDNVFQRGRYAVASNTAAFYVFRYNDVMVSPTYGTFGKAGVDVHEGDPIYYGGRGLEAYNNIIRRGGDYGNQAFKLRGGSGVVYNNTIIDVSTGIWLLKAEWAIEEQNYIKDLYIWDNEYQGVGTQLSKDEFYNENEHYFFYEKPGYFPYTYPHTLIGQPKTEKATRADFGSQKFYDGMGKEITSQVIDLYTLEKDNAELEDFKRYYNGMGRDISIPVMTQAKKIRKKP